VSLARKDAAEAASHLAILKGHLGEPALGQAGCRARSRTRAGSRFVVTRE